MPKLVLTALCFLGLSFVRWVEAAPPFSGTIFIDPEIITPTDPSTFQGASSAGRGMRWMFDRRVNDWTFVNAYLFNASFDDGLATEIQVNPEFGNNAAASAEALKYGAVIGRLPTALRAEVETVWIHRGTQPFGGGNNNLLIHTGQADLYSSDGILEETLVHEASHTSLDAAHASASGWLAAQTADGEFISTYARDNPDREDIAESFLPYLGARYRADRISASLFDTISQTIPNRIDYFDDQSFDLYPIVGSQWARGDIDEDGDVDRRDVVLFAAHLGRSAGSTWTTGDFNMDAATTLGDLHLLQSHFAPSIVAMPIPEPATCTVLVLGGLAMWVRYRAHHRTVLCR